MSYQTANEMYAALSEHIDDEDFVMRAVRTAFPQWKQDQQRKPKPAPIKPSPIPHNIAEIQHRASVERGSLDLLKALHREHPSIMRALAEQGRQVVTP